MWELPLAYKPAVGGGWGGGGGVPMSIIRNGNVALSNLRKPLSILRKCHVALSIKIVPCRPVDFKKVPRSMLLRPKKGCVAMLILGVYIHSCGWTKPQRQG